MGKTKDNLICKDCSAEFKHNTSLARHKASKCGIVKSYKCLSCSRSFDRKDSLLRHSKSCKKGVIKPTSCHKCGKGFQTNWHLVRHLEACNQKCQHCKIKITGDLDEHVCVPKLKVKFPTKTNKKVQPEEDQVVDADEIDYYEFAEELGIRIAILSIETEDLDVDFCVNTEEQPTSSTLQIVETIGEEQPTSSTLQIVETIGEEQPTSSTLQIVETIGEEPASPTLETVETIGELPVTPQLDKTFSKSEDVAV